MADETTTPEPVATTPTAEVQVEQPSKLSAHDLFTLLHSWFQLDKAHCEPWHKQAKEDFAFRASHGQWTELERNTLDAQKRAATVFNRTLPLIKAVAGMEINSRHEVIFLPRSGPPDERGRIMVKANETLSAASRWMDDTSDAEDHQSEAFQDMLTCGMGWAAPLVSYDDDPKGLYTEPCVDPREMYWDYRARAKNLTDRQRQWRKRRMLRSEAKALFPDARMEDLNCTWVMVGTDGEPVNTDPERRHKEGNNEGIEADRDPQSEVTLLQAQWWEFEPIWLVAVPEKPDEPVVLTNDQFTEFRKQAKQLEVMAAELGQPSPITYSAVKGRRKVYKQAWIGKTLLGTVDKATGKTKIVEAPQDPNGFTFHCITGEADKVKGTWFGLVSLARDPQRFANLTLSQTAHILNSTAKGGVIAETDAFDDVAQAEQTYARPDAITWAKPGSVSKNKIMAKPGAGLAAGHVNMLTYAIDSIWAVVGLNPEVLGMRNADQPGVLEAQRKQAAMTILATLFDSLRRFRKLIGRTRLSFIQRYFADGRLVLLAGDDGYELVKLLKDRVIGEYEVVVSDAPTSPNQKQETWGVIQAVLPAFKELMTPEVAVLILEFSPLPSKLVDGLKSLVVKEPPPEVKAQQQLAIAEGQAKVEKDKASAEASRAKALLDLANTAAQEMANQYTAAQAKIAAALAGTPGPAMPDNAPLIEPTGPVAPQPAGPPLMPAPAETPPMPELPAGPGAMPDEGRVI